MDLSLPPVENSERLDIIVPLASWAQAYDLETAVFVAEVRDERGASTVRYKWRTGGSGEFPNSETTFDAQSGVLKLSAPSFDMIEAFPPAVVDERGDPGAFAWELGFYLAAAPTDMIGIGVGDFPVRNGVIR